MQIPAENNAALRPLNSPDPENGSATAVTTEKKPTIDQDGLRVLPAEGSRQAVGAASLGRASLLEPGSLPRSSAPADPARLQAVADRLDQLQESQTIFDLFAVMSLICLVTIQQRQASRETARAALDAQVKSIISQSEKMRESAEDAYQGALVSGILTIVGGAVSIAGSLRSMYIGHVNPTQAGLMKAQNWQTLGSSVGQMAGAGGQLGKADYDREAQIKQADSKKLEAESMKAGGEREEALKMRDTMLEHFSSTLAAMRQILQGREQTTSRIFA